MIGTLSFALGDGILRREHDRILDTVLRRGAEAPERRPGETIDTSRYDDRTLSAARNVWTRRMVNEHHSAAVFARLVPQLMEAGATLDVKTSVLRMSMDELRHGALCAEVSEALGGSREVEVDLETPDLAVHPGTTAAERALRNVIFIGCLAETVAVAFTAEERDCTEDPYVKRVITQISADETLHARFGWDYLRRAAPGLADDERAGTSRWLRTAFAYLEREEMLEVPNVAPPSEVLRDEGLTLGVCDNRDTRELFYETVETVIVPGLEAAGLDARGAWASRRAA